VDPYDCHTSLVIAREGGIGGCALDVEVENGAGLKREFIGHKSRIGGDGALEDTVAVGIYLHRYATIILFKNRPSQRRIGESLLCEPA
jgi:hypothetical protein